MSKGIVAPLWARLGLAALVCSLFSFGGLVRDARGFIRRSEVSKTSSLNDSIGRGPVLDACIGSSPPLGSVLGILALNLWVYN